MRGFRHRVLPAPREPRLHGKDEEETAGSVHSGGASSDVRPLVDAPPAIDLDDERSRGMALEGPGLSRRAAL